MTMEIKDIDLTKCVNCCYKAVIDGVDDRGRICANGKDVYLRSDVKGLPVVSWDDIERGFAGKEVKGFEIVPRDPETYRDWQVGDKVSKEEHRNACFEVIFRSGELVVMKTNANTACSNYTCDELFGCGYRLVLTDIERQIIEEKKVVEDIPKPYEFYKGEPVLVRSDYGRDWVVSVYVENSSNPEAQFGKYGATDGRSIIFYRFCLPYNERTMHLLGTTEDYKEE